MKHAFTPEEWTLRQQQAAADLAEVDGLARSMHYRPTFLRHTRADGGVRRGVRARCWNMYHPDPANRTEWGQNVGCRAEKRLQLKLHDLPLYIASPKRVREIEAQWRKRVAASTSPQAKLKQKLRQRKMRLARFLKTFGRGFKSFFRMFSSRGRKFYREAEAS